MLEKKCGKITPEIGALIKKAYKQPKYGGIIAIARQFKISASTISRYANCQGYSKKYSKYSHWSDKELYIITRNARLNNKLIADKLKAAGFCRTPMAINHKKNKLKLRKNLIGMTLIDASFCLGKSVDFVRNMIREKKLIATRRNYDNENNHDRWYITDHNLKNFIIENIHLIELHQMDKYWLITLFTKK